MLCSKCSEVLKPVVAIDIDGTLGDYHTHLHAFAEGWLGRVVSGQPYRGAQPYHEWFCEAFAVDITTFRSVKLAYRQGGAKRTMPAYSLSAALVAGLRAGGAEVWLTTTRPHDRFDRVDPDTRAWLERNRIEFDGLLFAGDKIRELTERVAWERVIAVLDDQVDVLEESASWFGAAVPILRKTQYNQAKRWPIEVYNLADAEAIINERLADWRAKETT